MNALLFCFMLAQSLIGTHEMLPGTVVMLAAPELVPVYSSAKLEQHKLVFSTALEPETEVRVLIIPPGGEAVSSEAPYGRIGPNGDDIFVQFGDSTKAVSLRKWLADEYGVALIFAPSNSSGN